MKDIIGFDGESYDAVRVVRIYDPVPSEKLTTANSSVLQISDRDAYRITREIILPPSETNLLLGLWNALPDDEQARCHWPLYGFQLISEKEIVFSAAVCFQCNNISMGGHLASDTWRRFGAGSRQGQAFRQAFESLLARGFDRHP